ncbi:MULTISPECIES: dolichyl-phosphate-mannose--protein mannosyltransferase [unclassified Microbacterium]|uniref:dolichyl-phosphate-mannose--protein mannosyltransferase n=1 Tax=unclassified Microbacterium TaxID=2609290 RepID=UPI000EAACC43|nr:MULTISPECIES: phospholipid carrier-dependent glycosyltransferase [unclassified Microbacterium]MBT2486858.1 phospholipid carrier-dependent glycosyltransferase [Microbacterium sp. ISL-108]RKN64777.1 phospholipid carrier-dependent glycosyltransferase [Microbacterium sp. CGR2]
MTAPVPLLPDPEERLTRYGQLRDRLLQSPDWGRAIGWLAPLLVTTVAALLRLVNLGHPHQLAFDETYYVKDAWSLWTLGYEGTWGEGANEAFLTLQELPLSDTGAFVVHPPLGKWLIALGMAIGGPDNSAGWRLATALLGAGSVLLVYLIARRLTGSVVVATVAGTLLAIDGLSIVMSRIALLDGILTFFILLGLMFVLIDRQRTIPLLEKRDPEAPDPFWGPVLWRRPWLIAAGAALGAASAVKWSGLYALAGLGLYVVVTDALARRRGGVVLWPTSAAFRQGPVSFVLVVFPALAVYLISWTGWLVTAGGYDRQSDANPLVALWEYHRSILGFHVGLSSGHSYASPAWQWPLLLRPTAVWVGEDSTGCGTDHCIAVISAVPNPLIWYGGVAASVYLIYRLVRGWITRQPVAPALSVALVGLAVTYLPWLMFPERTIFQFYTVVMMPFLVLALTMTLRIIAGRREDPLSRRQAGERTVVVFLVFVVLVSAFFYPLWTGMSVPYDFWLLHNWLPGWV